MRNQMRVSACMTLTIISAATMVYAGEGVLLKPRFTPGQTHYIEGRAESKQSIKSPMGAMDISIIKKSGQFQKVESTSMDGLEFSIVMERMNLMLDNPMTGELAYDSDIPSMKEAPNLKHMIVPMLGEKMTVKADRDYKVTDVTGIDEILAKVEKTNAGNPFVAGLRATLNKETISRQWRSIQIDILPNKEVNIGDTWKYYPEEDIVQPPLSVKFDCTCKLDRVGKQDGRNVAFVSFEGKPTEYKPRAQPDGTLPELEIKSGSLKGTFVFNLDEGRMLERNYDSDFVLKSLPPKEVKGDKAGAADGGVVISLKAKNFIAFRTPDDRAKEKAANAKKAAEIKAKEEKEVAEDEDGDDEAADDE